MDSTKYNFSDIPISALSFKARDLLCKQLDKIKILPSPEGLPRDYRGLAQVAGVSCSDVRNPTLGVISLWSTLTPCPTFDQLLEALGRLDRWDLSEDVRPVLEIDALNYSLKQRQVCVYDQQVQSPQQHNIVTYDDADLVRIGLPPNQMYDAYLLYADQDEDIAQDVVFKLENEYKLKLCVKDRDIVPGAGFEHEAITYLISERCNWLIVIITPNFIDCPAQKFIYNYSVALGLSERRNKIIPCVFKVSSDSAVTQKLFKLTYSAHPVNFTRKNAFIDNWLKLSNAISLPRSVIISGPKSIASSSVPKIKENSSNSVQDVTKNINAVSIADSTHSVAPAPDRPPRSKSKQNSVANRKSGEIVMESSSNNNSTANLLPSASEKSRLSPIANLMTEFKKTKIAKTCKNIVKKKKKNKMMAEALAS